MKEVIEFSDDSKLNKLDSMISKSISNKKYPLTKGIPFCCAKIEHCIELFIGNGSGNKPKTCDLCKLRQWCNYNGEHFDIKPIINCDVDLLKFVEERDSKKNLMDENFSVSDEEYNETDNSSSNMKVLMIGFNIQEDVFPLGLSYLKNYAAKYHNDVEFNIREYCFGNRSDHDSNANIELRAMSEILIEKPDLVCFSCYIWNSKIIKNICKALRKMSDIKICLGGVEVDDSFEDYCDYLVKGEGEVKFKEVIDSLKGSSYSENEKIVENLDELPFPYIDYEGKKEFSVARIETTRGCPYNCKYCNYAMRECREFSLDYLKENIKYLFDNFKFKNLTILDANFNINKTRMKEILKIIKGCSRKVIVNFELKPELIDSEVVSIIKDSGLNINCEIGLQSIDKEVLSQCDRMYDLEKVKKGLNLLNENNVRYKIDMMYGLPKDNFFKFLRTVNFIIKYSKQKQLPAHHFKVLNNTKYSGCIRYLNDTSSMIIKTDSQDVVDLYKQKLFLDVINEN